MSMIFNTAETTNNTPNTTFNTLRQRPRGEAMSVEVTKGNRF